jgi:hypothetical protein
MVTGNVHEILKGLIGQIVNAVAAGLDIDQVGCGKTTWKTTTRGLEADLPYYFDAENPDGQGGVGPQVVGPGRLSPAGHGGRDRHLAFSGRSPVDLQPMSIAISRYPERTSQRVRKTGRSGRPRASNR